MTTQVDLQSIADTHERPFLIIDKDSCIVAANQAFLAAYGSSLPEILNRPCYEVTHNNPRPCYEMGEECPNQRIQETGKPHACLHVHTHYDKGRHIHHVRVKGFPLRLEDGELYYGELFEELAVQEVVEDDRQYMVGSSNAFLGTLETMKRAAKSDAPILIQGETGTGKELAASFVHRNSPRAKGPFLTLDCTVLTETLVESELFGHIRGAFTGSVGDRHGLFKLADGGTLFLDEIGELQKPLQINLQAASAQATGAAIGSDLIKRTISGRPIAGLSVTPRIPDSHEDPPHQTRTPGDGASLQELESDHLQRLLEQNNGDKSAVAAVLGVSLRTVYRKLKRYDLN